MKKRRAFTVLFCLAFSSRVDAVRLVVTVPPSTPKDATIFLAGSLDSVGAWKVDGLRLTRNDDGNYTSDIDVPDGKTLDYKINRGSWETVEKAADGGEIANRSLSADAGPEVQITVARWANANEASPTTRASTVVGVLQILTLDVGPNGAKRTVRVWLPPGYDPGRAAGYPVLYMQDGQNCFDAATSFAGEWQIDETVTRLIAEKKLAPLIVVGIDNAGAARIDEYTTAVDGERGGKGEAYEKMLLERIKPQVDAAYHTRPDRAHTFVGGSSLGALISLDLVHRFPEIVGGAIVMSPSLWWAAQAMTKAYEADLKPVAASRLWLDIGTTEGDDAADRAASVANAKRLDAILTHGGVEHRFVIDEGAAHNESAWARRFSDAIQYLTVER